MLFGSGGLVTGLDVGTTSVKAATLKHGSGRPKLVGLAMAEIPPSADWADAAAEAVRAALDRSGRTDDSPVVSAVGGPGVSVKHVTFPEMPKQALAESIRWEARKHVPFEGSDFVLDFQPLEGANGKDNGELQVLLAAVETRLLDSHVELLGKAGVEPDIVDLTPLALVNEMDEEGLFDGDALAVIDLGVKAITMAVYRRRGLFFARSIPLLWKPEASAESEHGESESGRSDETRPKEPKSGKRGKTKSAETHGSKSAGHADLKPRGENGGASAHDEGKAWYKTLSRELRRSLTFYHNETKKQGIERIYLTGGRALTGGIDKKLQSELGIQTEVLNPLKNMAESAVNTGSLEPEGPRFAVALGLARRQ